MNIKRKKSFRPVFWGVVLVLAAVLLILDGVGVSFGEGISAWRIILGVGLAAWVVSLIIRLKFTDLFFPLAFLFMVFEDPIARAVGKEDGNLISNWLILLAALMLTIGFKAIFSKHGAVYISKSGGREEKTAGRLGNTTVYIDASDLEDYKISDNLGTVRVYISNRENYKGGGTLTICDNLGSITLNIPKEWKVIAQTSDNLGRVSIPENPDAGETALNLVITDNLGNVSIVFE